jgi:cytochrome c-type biogenesis protein CcmH/NrfF
MDALKSGAVAAILLGLILAGSVAAESEEDSARRALQLSSSIMSPFCPGRALTDCPSPDAGALREEIRALLGSGMGEDAIRAELRRRYGNVVTPEPTSGWGWVLPASILLVGMALLGYALLRLSRGRAGEALSRPASTPAGDLEAEIDRDLSERGL